MTYKIFVSHYSADEAVAEAISNLVDDAFAGHVEPFISSSIPIGKNWLSQTKDALVASDEIFTVFTHRSSSRPWIHIETGYGIMADKPVTPILFNGFTASDLSVIYQLQHAVDERIDADVAKLWTDVMQRLKGKAPRARAKLSSDQFVAAWRAAVSHVARRSPVTSAAAVDTPLIWIIGSHDALSAREQIEALSLVRTVARVCFENRFRLVCGVSRLLEYLADSYDAFASGEISLGDTPGEPWRKALGAAHVDTGGFAHNPIIIVGSLRSPSIRERFDDALGRIPDLAVVIGGRSKAAGGRTHDECAAAIAAGIPLLPIAFSGGAAAEVQPSLNSEAGKLAPNLGATQGKLDVFASAFLEIIRRQLMLD